MSVSAGASTTPNSPFGKGEGLMDDAARLTGFPTPQPRVPGRDISQSVMLVGFQHQGNLGLGYLAATLRKAGYEVEVSDFEADGSRIVALAQATRPIIVGFSLIFQFYLPQFTALIRRLRQGGVRAHFTMGGHFPSLS